ncbi:hypothetical protein cyc_05636 [Cyclospora cayetanensis]|uniref:Uncharacterized protein n=1 Tax=Cyclospora cayetanensis TaxID=88456 RepID=A0A1D3D4M1_9EIME|nr:hypothetical protein cyc_05636 [Cyclospora cayetanensis]
MQQSMQKPQSHFLLPGRCLGKQQRAVAGGVTSAGGVAGVLTQVASRRQQLQDSRLSLLQQLKGLKKLQAHAAASPPQQQPLSPRRMHANEASAQQILPLLRLLSSYPRVFQPTVGLELIGGRLLRSSTTFLQLALDSNVRGSKKLLWQLRGCCLLRGRVIYVEKITRVAK